MRHTCFVMIYKGVVVAAEQMYLMTAPFCSIFHHCREVLINNYNLCIRPELRVPRLEIDQDMSRTHLNFTWTGIDINSGPKYQLEPTGNQKFMELYALFTTRTFFIVIYCIPLPAELQIHTTSPLSQVQCVIITYRVYKRWLQLSKNAYCATHTVRRA